ncbi:MAG TPA: Ig-like domain-containing protein, partial [Patescibacteria group bacterium]|nr:Ig-like domain-containing protein [Patescibacteria group bacterium]
HNGACVRELYLDYVQVQDTTPPPPPSDSTPPTVSIATPASGATVSGVVNIGAAASDNVGVAKVEFYIDSTLVSTVTASPYNYSWNTATATNGSHIVTAKAYDAANNSMSANENVTVSNANINSAPPSPAGYFTLQPVGSWSSLPNDSQCAASVHNSTWEPRLENFQQNNTMPAPGAMAQSFAIRPRDQGNTYDSRWDSWLLPRVDGQFTGTTDEILQWAACKWGLPDNLIRADAADESTWFEYLHFPNNASFGGGGGGSSYWNRGSGDAFSAASAASTTFCQGIASQAILSTDIHDYQKDPITTYGGYPYTPGTGLCPKTYSILGVMSWDDPAWEAPYPAYQGNQNGTFPFTRDSTAAAADYWGAQIRGCYEGWESWLKNTGTKTYAAGDLWGCMGAWYSGDWHSTPATTYITNVQTNENNLIWLNSAFDDSAQQYHCDPIYGCPK